MSSVKKAYILACRWTRTAGPESQVCSSCMKLSRVGSSMRHRSSHPQHVPLLSLNFALSKPLIWAFFKQMVTVFTQQTIRRCHRESEAASVTKSDTQPIVKDSSLTTWHEVDLAHNLTQMAWSTLKSTHKHTHTHTHTHRHAHDFTLFLPKLNDHSHFDQFQTNDTVL